MTDNLTYDQQPHDPSLDYHALNAMLNLVGKDGKLQLDADKEAVRQFFLQHVNQNTVYFSDLEEKIEYLIDNNYYEEDFIEQYNWEFVKSLYKRAYGYKFRFRTFMGAFKYYSSYTLKTFDGKRYLERYEDRVVANALYLAQGNEELATSILDEIMQGRYQPATPTFLNAGKAQRGELVSCFLLRVEDNLESISRSITNALQLSKRGGGVALLLTNLRETGAPIKKIENQSSGVVPVMKLLEDSFSYANQLGARQGAGAVYLHAHHPDIMTFLDTKRENADEKIRIKTLSLGVVIPDITFELAKKNDDMYLFSPYDIERVYGVPMSDISVTEKYYEMVDNPEIRKKKISARKLFMTLAEITAQSGYPYLLFEDNANRAHALDGRINMSNLCVSGDTRLLTDKGYRRFDDLYNTQEDFKVLSDNRSVNEDFKDATVSLKDSTKMFLTKSDAEVFKVSTKEGFEIKATEWHKFPVETDGKIVVKRLGELEVGDHLLVQPKEGVFGSVHNPDLAYIAGVIAADGTFAHSITSAGNEVNTAKIYLYGDKSEAKDSVLGAVHRVLSNRNDLVERQSTLTPDWTYNEDTDRLSLHSAPLAKLLAEYGFTRHTKTVVPEFVWQGDKETVTAYLSGLYQMDSCITGSKSAKNMSIELGSSDKKFIQEVQSLLLNIGVFSRIYTNRSSSGKAFMPNGHGGYAEYNQSANWTLRVSSGHDRTILYNTLTWLKRHHQAWENLSQDLFRKGRQRGFHKFRATVTGVEFHSIEDVYDVTVDDGHTITCNGLTTRNCSEILQANESSEYNTDGSYKHVGKDISCNLGSMNIAKTFDSPDFSKSIEIAMRSLSAVSDMSDVEAVPSVKNGNKSTHAVGLGQMNLHGFLAREHIHYDSPEAVDFANLYAYAVNYESIVASNKIAIERGEVFDGFEKSKYADGTYFDKYIEKDWSVPETSKVTELFKKSTIHIPTPQDWKNLREKVMEYGLYNGYRQAYAPNGSTSYIFDCTSSIHPIVSPIEIRKEGKLGRVYYPAPYLSDDTLPYYKDAYKLGYKPIIDVYAAMTQHVDQGLSLTLFWNDTVTTRDMNKAYIYAFSKGIKTIYYGRIKQESLSGTQVEGTAAGYCESCMI